MLDIATIWQFLNSTSETHAVCSRCSACASLQSWRQASHQPSANARAGAAIPAGAQQRFRTSPRRCGGRSGDGAAPDDTSSGGAAWRQLFQLQHPRATHHANKSGSVNRRSLGADPLGSHYPADAETARGNPSSSCARLLRDLAISESSSDALSGQERHRRSASAPIGAGERIPSLLRCYIIEPRHNYERL